MISLFFANIIGFFVANWRVVLTIAASVALLVVLGLVLRSCEPKPKFNENEIREAQTAIEEKDRKKMVDILANSDLKEKAIDANLANADNEKLKALGESRKKYDGLSNEDLAKQLEARK